MSLFRNHSGELKAFRPEAVGDEDWYWEPVLIWEPVPGQPWRGGARRGFVLWKRVEPWDAAEIRDQKGLTNIFYPVE